jgi:hypothetical protein
MKQPIPHILCSYTLTLPEITDLMLIGGGGPACWLSAAAAIVWEAVKPLVLNSAAITRLFKELVSGLCSTLKMVSF